MKIHMASEGVGYDEYDRGSFIAMTRDCLASIR